MSLLIRLRYAVAAHGPRIAVALLLVGALSFGVAGWAYANPPTTTVTDRTDVQTVGAEVRTSAVATGNTSFYEPGTELRNRPVYLLSSAPELRLDLQATVPDGQPVRLDRRVSLVYNATYGGDPLWNDSRVVLRREATVRDGSATARTTLDVREIHRRATELDRELGRRGTVDVSVRVRVDYETDRYDGTLSETVPLRFADESYVINPTDVEETRGTPVTRTVPLPDRDPTPYAIPAALGVVALAAGAGTLVVHRRGPGPADLGHDLQRARYEAWISTGALPRELTADAIPMRSLEDLVDVAIDSDKRVVYDPDRGLYAVVDGDAVYQYDEERLPKTYFTDG